MAGEGLVRRCAAISLALTAAVALSVTVLVIWRFPFRRAAIVKRVQDATGARIETGSYREKWFPPGFTAERVRLSDPEGNVLTVSELALDGSYTGLLRNPRVLTRIQARGVRVLIPSLKNRPALRSKESGSSFVVGEIRLHDAVPDVLPLKFQIHSRVLTHV